MNDHLLNRGERFKVYLQSLSRCAEILEFANAVKFGARHLEIKAMRYWSHLWKILVLFEGLKKTIFPGGSG